MVKNAVANTSSPSLWWVDRDTAEPPADKKNALRSAQLPIPTSPSFWTQKLNNTELRWRRRDNRCISQRALRTEDRACEQIVRAVKIV